MSKSLKNTISIGDLLKNTPSDVFRMACIMTHYRSGMEFTSEFMLTASNVLENFKNFLHNCQLYYSNAGVIQVNVNEEVLMKLLINSSDKIDNALKDDFNTPLVISVLSEIVLTTNSLLNNNSRSEPLISSKSSLILAISNFVCSILNMFGVSLEQSVSLNNISKSDNFVEVMDVLNNFRQEVRQLGISKKDEDILKLCDFVRDELKKGGIIVRDHRKSSTWIS